MTSPRLAQILRHVERRQLAEKVQQPKGDISAMIQQLVDRQVEERVSAELDRERLQQHSPRVQFNAPAPASESPPRTPAPPKDLTSIIHRDGKGRAAWIEIGGLRFDVQRNEFGRVTGMVQREESPVLPQPEIPFKASAREYHDGEPR